MNYQPLTPRSAIHNGLLPDERGGKRNGPYEVIGYTDELRGPGCPDCGTDEQVVEGVCERCGRHVSIELVEESHELSD